MLAYYAEERADGCDIDADGDMLLFQWGVYDWGNAPAFEVNITRQLITPANDEPRQLSLTFRFDAASAPKDLEAGNKWCGSPEEVEDFHSFVSTSPTLRAVSQVKPIEIALRFERQ